MPNLEFADLPRSLNLAEPGKAGEFTYFPETGIGSVVVPSFEPDAEVGLFGREGLTPAPTSGASGVSTSPYHVFMQVPGTGHRIGKRPPLVSHGSQARANLSTPQPCSRSRRTGLRRKWSMRSPALRVKASRKYRTALSLAALRATACFARGCGRASRLAVARQSTQVVCIVVSAVLVYDCDGRRQD